MITWFELAMGLGALWALWGVAFRLASSRPPEHAPEVRARAEALSRDIESTLTALHQRAG